MIAIDILYLVDRLEALLSKGGRVPMTAKVLVSEDEFLDIVEQMRIAVPEEIKQAKKVQQDRERVLAQAQEEAARLLALAKEDSARLVNDSAISKAAQERAKQIEEQAHANAETIRQGADSYAAQVLGDIQSRLEEIAQHVASLQTQVYNGMSYIGAQETSTPTNADQNVS
jgi:cell division septum initiation protein DivIVA